ncbi:uncharacterized protein EDB91DRAFT_335786 [Suillus paluster]|uniref:uncharacterized protein n=1 Tax=Suillus paluster TaxID=48578 RepID=UPI001B861AC2|nr:uncharacterized protein EDB91DRAFT_335786 [Suillus paluster]KAG1720548.1 hypothetical protein EDB91DRAFT_335786 [Suillus paluster]
MFTSLPSIIFALLSSLAGVNACIQCPGSLKVDGSVSHLSSTNPFDQFTFCFYTNANLSGGDSSVACEYDNETANLLFGYESCPVTATMKNNC